MTRQSYVPIIARHFPAARGLGEAANHPILTDLHYLTSSVVAGRMSGSDLCELVNGGTREAELCEYLANRRAEIWTAPVVTVAEEIIERRDQGTI